MVAPLLLAACETEPAARGASDEVHPADQGGRIVDLAGALSEQEERELARRLASGHQADGRPVMVVVIEASKEQSLEQVGWAVGGRAGATRPFLVLVDPATRRVRFEGDLHPEQKAAVAAAMTEDLAAGRTAAAIGRGLTRLEQLAP
jgi:uncharacterized membrane protein YgcG